MSEMMNWTTFTIVNMVRITGVEISQKPESAKTNRNYERFENTVNLIYTVSAMEEVMIWTKFTIIGMVRITGVEIS